MEGIDEDAPPELPEGVLELLLELPLEPDEPLELLLDPLDPDEPELGELGCEGMLEDC